MTQASDDRDRTNRDDEAGRAESEPAHAPGEVPPLDAELLAELHPDVAECLRACIPILDATDAGSDGEPKGTRLGDFILMRPIGRGGMGVVFEARQLSLRRRVAVKILPQAAALDPLRLSRFQIEAQAAARLHHTNIVPVFSVGCDRGVHFYAMQYIDGLTLGDWLRKARGIDVDPRAPAHNIVSGDIPLTELDTIQAGAPRRDPAVPEASTTVSLSLPYGPINPRRVAELGVQAADALEHAHRQGVIHRDVKPSNMMVDGRGVLWITDFGLARVAGDPSLTLAGDLLGTLRYMSPEQSSGDSSQLDGRTDVYSLGATLYELLTLHPAREGVDRETLLAAIAAEEPRRLRAWNRSIPRDLETIVLHSLARERDSRYKTAGEMAADLRRFLDGRPILARRPSLVKRAERWVRRHKALVASLVFALTLAIGAGAALLTLTAHNHHLARSKRRADYVYDVAQAGDYIHRNDLASAMDLLSRHIPAPGAEDDRGFVWHHLWRLCNFRPKRLEGHKGDVYHVEYSPDGRTFVTAGQDGTVRLWDAETDALLRTYRGHDGDVDWATFSPDGERLASCGNDGTVRLWDATDASIPSQVLTQTDLEIVAVVFTRDGRSVIWGGNAGVVVSLDLATGNRTELANTSGRRIGAFAVSRDGRSLGVAYDDKPGFLRLDLADGGIHPDPGSDNVNCVAVSADGETVAIGNKGGEVRVASQGREFASFCSDPDATVETVALSPDGRLMATSGSPGIITLRDVRENYILGTYRSRIRRHWSLAFAPRGDRLIACGPEGSVEAWDLALAQDRRTLEAPLSPSVRTEPAWSSHSMTAATIECDDVRFYTWDLDSGDVVPRGTVYAPNLGGVAISPDQTRAILRFNHPRSPLRLVSLAPSSDTISRDLEVPEVNPDWPYNIWAATFSNDGERLLLAYDVFKTASLGVWTVADGKRAPLFPRVTDGHCPIVFSPDGRWLALIRPRDVSVLDSMSPEYIKLTPPDLGWPTVAAWASDGRRIAVGYGNGAIAVLNLDKPKAEAVVLNSVYGLHALAFSPDGRLLACASSNGSTMLMDIATRGPIQTFSGPPLPRSAVVQVRFSPDGSTLSRLTYGGGRPAVIVNWPTSR